MCTTTITRADTLSLLTTRFMTTGTIGVRMLERRFSTAREGTIAAAGCRSALVLGTAATSAARSGIEATSAAMAYTAGDKRLEGVVGLRIPAWAAITSGGANGKVGKMPAVRTHRSHGFRRLGALYSRRPEYDQNRQEAYYQRGCSYYSSPLCLRLDVLPDKDRQSCDNSYP